MAWYTTLFKIICAVFVPLPLNPRIDRDATKKNTWTVSCDGFTTVFGELKVFWKTPAIEALLGKSRPMANDDAPPPAPPTPPPSPKAPPRPPSPETPAYIAARRPSLRGSALSS